MKNLHLSVLTPVLLLICGINTAYAQYAAQEPSFSVYSDKRVYLNEETVTISGKIASDLLQAGLPVLVLIFDPFGSNFITERIEVLQSRIGSFVYALNLDKKHIDGKYLVIARYGSMETKTVFFVGKEATVLVCSNGINTFLLKKGDGVKIPISITYLYAPGYDIPKKVHVDIRPDGGHIVLEAAKKFDALGSRVLYEKVSEQVENKKQGPCAFTPSWMTSFDSTNIEILADTTKSLIMTVKVPDDFPDELLDRTIIIRVSVVLDPWLPYDTIFVKNDVMPIKIKVKS